MTNWEHEPRWRRYLRFWRRNPATDISDELQFHLANRIAEYETAGMSRADAIAAAFARFGDIAAVRGDLTRIDARIARRWRIWQVIDALRTDARYVIRSLYRRPAVAMTVTITLAIAIGANCALFSLLDPILFRPPAGVAHPESLRRIYTFRPGMETNFRVGSRFSYPEYRALQRALLGQASLAIDQPSDSVQVSSDDDSFTTGVSYVTADYLAVLGVRPLRGRFFSTAEDDVASPANVAVISRVLAERMGGPDAALGKHLRIRDRNYVVIGVAAARFDGLGLGLTSVWLPFSGMPREAPPPNQKPWYDRSDRYITLLARLSKDASGPSVEARASVAYRRFLSEKRYDSSAAILVGPLSVARAPERRDSSTLVATRTFAVAAMLLIIACANVSNLFLALALSRRREIGVRLALGVPRVRLALLMVLESLALASIASLGAVVVAEWAGRLLRAQLRPGIAWPHAAVGLRVLAFTGVTTLAAALCSAVLPALLVWRANAGDAFRGGIFRATPGHHRTRSALLAVQATLSLMLIAGTALFARSLQAARDADLGYDRGRLITTHVWFPDRSRRAAIGALMPSLKERVARMPGVELVSLAYGGPMNQWTQVPLYRPSADSAHPIEGGAYFIGVSAEYFALTGTRLVDGRGFLPSDRAGSAPVIVVGASMARQLWPNQRAIGQCLRPVGPSHACYTVVGVAGDVHEFRVAENVGGWQYYYMNEQLPIRASERMLVVRARVRQAEVLAASITQLLRATFPGADAGARTIDQSLEAERRPWLLGFTLFGALACFAIVVAVVGVYGVVSFEVRQRTREIGIRLALGAQGARVVGMLVSQHTRVVGFGVALGLASTIGAGRYVQSLLYGVTPNDPLALSIAATLLLIAAAVAAMLPAWRAQRIDPASVLRDE